MLNDILPKKKKKQSSGGIGLANKQQKAGLEGIMEGKPGDEDIEEQSDDASQDGKSSASESDSNESSIDMDGEDEDKMYQNILKEQNKAD